MKMNKKKKTLINNEENRKHIIEMVKWLKRNEIRKKKK